MKYLLPMMFAALLLCGCAVDVAKVTTDTDAEIKKFHARFDGEQFNDVWQDAHPLFQNTMKEDDFVKTLAAMREKLGKVASSSTTGLRLESFNGINVAKVGRHTTFENGQRVEVFSFSIDEVPPSLMSYGISIELPPEMKR